MTSKQRTQYQNSNPQYEATLARMEHMCEQLLAETREFKAHSNPTNFRRNRPHEHHSREHAPRVQNERRNWVDDFGKDDEIEYPRQIHNRHDLVGQDLFRRTMIDPPTFDGHLNPEEFLEWISTMDQFFDWSKMCEERKIRFAKMILKGQARLFWIGVERQLAHKMQPPVSLWLEMKDRLMEKYLPPTYTRRLMDQLHTLSQGTNSVVEYMDKFEELMVKYNVKEDPRLTLSRFKLGLKPEIRKEILPHIAGTLDQAYQLALKIEQRLKIIPFRRMRSQPTYTLERQFFEPERSTKTLENNPTNRQPRVNQFAINQPKKSKNKIFTTESSKGSTSTKCYKCHGIRHYAY